jgi:hypothetical protein
MTRQRNNFTKGQMRDMRARSKDVCEAGSGGTEAFYGMQPGERCTAKATAFDHVTADALKRTKIKDISEGLHVCGNHHHVKTQTHDMPKIRKAVRLDEKAAGIEAPKAKIPSRGFVSRLKPDKSSRIAAAHQKHLEQMRKKIGA